MTEVKRKPKGFDKFGDCPECGVSWAGEDIPKEQHDMYAPPYKFSRLVLVKRGFLDDGGSYWQCPDCKSCWERYDVKEPIFKGATNAIANRALYVWKSLENYIYGCAEFTYEHLIEELMNSFSKSINDFAVIKIKLASGSNPSSFAMTALVFFLLLYGA